MYNFSDVLKQLDGIYESMSKQPLTEAIESEVLVAEFVKGLQGWSYEQWQAAGSPDKESIVSDAIKALGLKPQQEVYDIFWEWAQGLTAADFGEDLTEGKATCLREAMQDADPAVADKINSLLDIYVEQSSVKKGIGDGEVMYRANLRAGGTQGQKLHDEMVAALQKAGFTVGMNLYMQEDGQIQKEPMSMILITGVK